MLLTHVVLLHCASPSPLSPPQSTFYSADQSFDAHLMDQEEEIRKAIADSQPLVGDKEPFTSLQQAYIDNPAFLHKLQTGASTYSHIRRVRGDGNCFYRSLLFAVLEFALLPPRSIFPLRHYQLVSAFHQRFIASPAAILSSGVYSDLIVDDFYELTLTLVNFATERTLTQQGLTSLIDPIERSTRQQLVDELSQRLNDASLAQWYMTWLRCLTSFQLQTHADDYAPYLVDHPSIKAFCASEVDVGNREVDALQILALCSEMGVAVHIEYLDGSEGGLKGYVIPEGKEAWVTLLYRPGHYDIIYRMEEEDKGGQGGTTGDGGGSERKEA